MVNRELQLYFYSRTAGRTRLEPQPGSTRPNGNGAEKKRASDPRFIPRWYAYVDDQSPEYRIAARPFKYQARVNTGLLYDIDGDNHNYYDDAQYADATLLEIALDEAGFFGLWSPRLGVAVLFQPLDCVQIAHERDLFELKDVI